YHGIWSSIHIDDHNPFQDAHLRSRKSYALGFIHGVIHVVNQLLKPRRHLLYLPAFFTENVVSQFSDISDSHTFLPPTVKMDSQGPYQIVYSKPGASPPGQAPSPAFLSRQAAGPDSRILHTALCGTH